MSVCISFSLITQFFFAMYPGCVHLLLCVISCLHCLVFVFHLSTRLIKMSMYSYYYLILVSICVLLYLIFFRISFLYFSKCQQWIYAQEVNRLAMKQFQANGDDINHHYLLCHRRGRLKKFMFWDENTNLYVSLKFLAECFRLKQKKSIIVLTRFLSILSKYGIFVSRSL